MHSVISLKDRSSKNIVCLIDANQQEHAHASVLVFARIQDILVLGDLDPFLLKHEVKVREVAVALGKDESLIKLVIVVAYVSEYFCDQIVEIEG